MKNNTKIIISAIISVLLVGTMIFATLASDVVVADDEVSSDAAELVSDAELVTEDAYETGSEIAEPASEEDESALPENPSEDASDEESSETERVIILGDVTGDGKVLADDARLALRGSARLEVLSEAQLLAADFNGDGILNADDARRILRFSARLPIEEISETASETASEAASAI